MGTWRRHSREFKLSVVKRMKTSDNIHELARELKLERKLMYTWKYQFEGRPEKNNANYCGEAPADTVETRQRREIRQLKEALGQKTAELDFFARALRRVKEDRLNNGGDSEPVSTLKSRRSRSRKAN